MSGLPPWLSDALCRIATGGGWAARQLYTDADEVLLDVQRPIALNGIESMVRRPDLGERSIIVNLQPINETERQTEKELWAAFAKQRPIILGGLLNAVSVEYNLVSSPANRQRSTDIPHHAHGSRVDEDVTLSLRCFHK